MNLDTIIINNEHQIRYEYTGNGVITVNDVVFNGDITTIRANIKKLKGNQNILLIKSLKTGIYSEQMMVNLY